MLTAFMNWYSIHTVHILY